MVDLSCQSADAMVDLSGQLECVSIVVFMYGGSQMSAIRYSGSWMPVIRYGGSHMSN